MYTELEIAIALNRKCCSSWILFGFLRWQMPRFQINSHTLYTRARCVYVRVCIVFHMLYARLLLFFIPKTGLSSACLHALSVGRSSSVSTTLWRFQQSWRSECARRIAHSKGICETENQFAVKKENRTYSTKQKQNKTKHVACHIASYNVRYWFDSLLSCALAKSLQLQQRTQSICLKVMRKLQWLWAELNFR